MIHHKHVLLLLPFDLEQNREKMNLHTINGCARIYVHIFMSIEVQWYIEKMWPNIILVEQKYNVWSYIILGDDPCKHG